MWLRFVMFDNSVLCDNVIGLALVASIIAVAICVHNFWGHGYDTQLLHQRHFSVLPETTKYKESYSKSLKIFE